MEDILKCEAAINLFVEKNFAFKIIKDFFPEIEEAVKILQNVQIVTKILQNVTCTLSDFFGEYVKMAEKIKLLDRRPNKQTDLAMHLVKQLGDRKDALFKNESMLCCVYLDRRYASLLKSEEVEFAKKALYKLYKRAIRIMKLDEPNETVESRVNNSFESGFDMEAFLVGKGCEPLSLDCDDDHDSVENPTMKTKFNTEMSEAQFLIILGQFESAHQRIHFSTSILKFWVEQNKHFPELYVLSTIMNSIPPAQASVERCFSVLSLVFTCRRCSISTEILQEILLINMNKCMVPMIFQAEREAINKNV